ncbi:protein transport protein Sec31A [Anopheles ziemanni]|uniref:protein transport protein Sec31A n=1 Tax=Anopheles coustani TaxID=139045 RepID=UPI00265B4D2F|nr:protein transport protein Sec31A [Anopheles coustani]XP_058174372.1 protein transport protein Sec31A [Anopheles ziemanni]
MKVKELQKMVNVAWSPAQQSSVMLAAGTAAQQLDASFNTAAALEVYSINLADPSYDLELKGSQPSAHRFQKLLWSPLVGGAGDPGTTPSGLITGGCESGVLQVYNVAQLLAGQNALVAQQEKHQGAVRSLDYNPFQYNLVASGASESEIFIWDLNNTAKPMSPGAKVAPLEDVQGLAWNRQVQHILASVFSSRCVIWDLRKNEPIIKLSDTQSRIRWRVAQWHPDVATQLWLASEEDQSPTVQLWDLRYATAPAKTFHIHQRGVLGLTWCPKDHDLVASCGKDNRIICWNQNTDDPNGEILSEIATTNQWNFDVAWCPRNPALLAGSSFDGNVSIYSIHGGVHQQVQTSNKIADSFPGMANIGHEPMQQVPAQSLTESNDLKRPPRWMRRPVGACFGFGGKLVTFNGNDRTVRVNQVVTDPELVERSNQLEQVLAEGNFVEYCRQKADQTNDQHSRLLWYFLKANFEGDPHAEMLNLLGYQAEDVADKFKKYVVESEPPGEQNPVDGLSDQMAGLSRITDNNAVFDAISAVNGGQQVDAEVRQMNGKPEQIPYKIRTGQDSEGLICEALLTGNLEAAVELCMQAGKTSEALILAMNGGSDLLAKVQYRYLKNHENYLSNIISALVTCDWTGVVTQCTVDSWKEALVAAITHCKGQLPLLCERLGERLQKEAGSNGELARNAILCYICAGSTERLVEAWNLSKGTGVDVGVGGEDELDKNNNSNRDLQELVEVSMLLQKALERQGRSSQAVGKLADLLSQYASLLAAQGSLPSALTYLGNSTDPEMEELRERLYYALGHKSYAPAPVYGGGAGSARPGYNNATGLGGVGQQPPPFNPMFPTIGQAAKMKSAYGQPAPPMVPTPVPVPTLNSTLAQPGWNTSPFQPPAASVPPPAVQPPMAASKPPMGPPPGNSLPADPAQPPRPSSVSSQSGGPTLGRAKYVLDPSVTSGPNYGQTSSNFYNPVAYQQPQPSTAPGGPFNSAPVMNQPAQAGQNQPSFYNPLQPAGGVGVPPTASQPNQPNAYKPFTPAPLVQPSPYIPDLSAGYGPPPSAAAGPPPLANVQRNPTPPPGWNDPPALKSSSRPQLKAEPQPMAPITSPLPAGLAPSNGYPDPNSNYMQPGGGGQYMQPQVPSMYNPSMSGGGPQPSMPPAPMSANANTINYQNFQQTAPGAAPPSAAPGQLGGPHGSVFYPGQGQQQDGGSYVQQQNAYQPPAPEPPKQKPPLPEQYVFMQTVFEELKKQCVASAGNPQTKRKLEDVSKRLESLYDLLRENRLSQNTLNSLNQLVALIQAGDYANGIGLHTQMVSGSDFAQIASFMPGIKVLLQSAMQLQVYLR